MRYGINSKTGIIIISAEKEDMGNISKANGEIFTIFGYNTADLIGQNIRKLVPSRKLQKNLERIIMNFMLKQESEKCEKMAEITLFGLNSSGYMIPVRILPHVFLSTSGKLQIFSFVNKEENLFLLSGSEDTINPKLVPFLLLDKKFTIQGFSQAIATLCDKKQHELDPKKYLKSEKNIKMKNLYPELFAYQSVWEMQTIGIYSPDFNLEPLKEAILSELMEFSIWQETNMEEKTSLMNIRVNQSGFNLRLKRIEFQVLEKTALFYVMSLIIHVDENMKNSTLTGSFGSNDWFKEESVKDNIFGLDVDDSCSIASSGIYIYIYIYS